MRGSIQKKGKSYYVVFRVIDENGKRKQKWISAGKSKREAEAKLIELMGDVQSGTYRELKKITFREFSKLWLESYVKTKTKPSTLRSYENIIHTHLIPSFGDYFLTDITTDKLQKYIADRLQTVKPKTVINEIVPIKKMFKHAVRWNYLKVNPAQYLERPRVEREEMSILTPDEISKLLNEFKSDGITPNRDRILILTAVQTGMRAGELYGLQRSDIDWTNLQVQVKHSLWRKQLITPKSERSKRKIDISPSLALELKKLILASPPSNFVFCDSKGNPIDHDNFIKRRFLPALRRAGIKPIRFHDLRHTNVALRIEAGQNIKYIQNQLGHASIQTTLDRYGHLIKEVNTEQAKKLDTMLGLTDREVAYA